MLRLNRKLFEAIQTLIQDGSVYLLEKEEMPEPSSLVNAILRF